MNHRRFRILAVGDDCTRENLALEADFAFSGARMARTLDVIATQRPSSWITGQRWRPWRCCDGPPIAAFACTILRQDNLVQNAFIESFNGRLREECLNEHDFKTLFEARRVQAEWRANNTTRSDRTRPWAGRRPRNLPKPSRLLHQPTFSMHPRRPNGDTVNLGGLIDADIDRLNPHMRDARSTSSAFHYLATSTTKLALTSANDFRGPMRQSIITRVGEDTSKSIFQTNT